MVDKKKAAAPATATLSLSGENLIRFNAVKRSMKETLPGTDPSNVEVLRYITYLAALFLNSQPCGDEVSGD